jgi:hypothetical protein
MKIHVLRLENDLCNLIHRVRDLFKLFLEPLLSDPISCDEPGLQAKQNKRNTGQESTLFEISMAGKARKQDLASSGES